MSSDKILTIVIPIFNKYRYTAHCLASIFHSTVPKTSYEVLFVDNASSDMTPTLLSYLQEQGEPIRVIRNQTNLGYLLGANQGWKEVKTPYCLHLNNDVVIWKDTIQLMLDTFQKDSKIGVVGAIQVSVDEVEGKLSEISHFYRTYFYRGEDVDKTEDIVYREALTEEEMKMDYVEVESLGFACAMVKREVWEKIGFFDTRFQPCMAEQEDYLLRVREAGWKVVEIPKTFFLHAIGATTEDNRNFYTGIVKRNKRLFKEKWGEKLRSGLI